jgi:hypothetical protein
VDLRHQAPGGGHPAQGGEERVVADEGSQRGGGGIAEPVADAYRLHGHPGVQGGLESGRAEAAVAPAAPGAALGEDDDGGPGAERVREVGDDLRQGPEAVAVDEEGAGAGDQWAEYGPGADLALGEHTGGPDGGEERDVEPGDVVGDDQHAAGGRQRLASDAYPYSESGRQGLGSGPDQFGGAAGERQHQESEEYDGEEGGGPGQPARAADGGRGAVGQAEHGRAGRGGEPDAHQAGTSERKWRR